jgi:hypothetical protein
MYAPAFNDDSIGILILENFKHVPKRPKTPSLYSWSKVVYLYID